MPATGPDARRESKACDGVADHLALTASEAADGIAHEQDLGKVIAAQGGSAEALAGAVLTLDGDAMVGVQSEIGSLIVRVGMLSFSAGALEFVLEFHLQR